MPSAAAIAVGSVAAGAMGASASKKAAKTAADAQTAAANQNAQLAREQRDMMRGYVDPLVPYAGAGASALASRVGLGNGSAANPFASATPAKPAGGMAGTSPMAPNYFAANTNMTMNAPGAGPAPPPQQSPERTQAYLAKYPDLAAEAQNVVGPGKQFQTPEQYLEWHDDNFASEGRDYTPAAQQWPAAPAPVAANGNPAPYGFGSDYTARSATERPQFSGTAPVANIGYDAFKNSGFFDGVLEDVWRGSNAASAGRGLMKSDYAQKALQGSAVKAINNLYFPWAGLGLQQAGQNQNQFNADRNQFNQNYDLDASRGDARYDADRNFTANRFDQQTNNIFGLTGIGTGAINILGGVGTNYTNSVMGSNSAAADATGNAAIAGANSANNLFGQAAQAIGNAYGNRNTANIFARPYQTYAGSGATDMNGLF